MQSTLETRKGERINSLNFFAAVWTNLSFSDLGALLPAAWNTVYSSELNLRLIELCLVNARYTGWLDKGYLQSVKHVSPVVGKHPLVLIWKQHLYFFAWIILPYNQRKPGLYFFFPNHTTSLTARYFEGTSCSKAPWMSELRLAYVAQLSSEKGVKFEW